MKNLYLRQQRVYFSTKTMPASNSFALEFFNDKSGTSKSNLEIANQISNSGTYEIFVWDVHLSKVDGTVITDADIILFNKIIATGNITLTANRVDVGDFNLAKCLAPMATVAGAVNLSDSTKGHYKLNVPVKIGMGQSFKVFLNADPQVDTSTLQLIIGWDGILDLSQEVVTAPAQLVR